MQVNINGQIRLLTLFLSVAFGQICTVDLTDIDTVTQALKLPYDQHDNGQPSGFVFDFLNPEHAESVAGKTYVITGTSSGIGHATANLLVSMGATVYGFSLDDDIPIEGFTEIKCDIRNEGQVNAAITRLQYQYGVTAIDGLILNAGTALVGSCIHMPAEEALDSYNNNENGNKHVHSALSVAGMFRNAPGEKRVIWTSSIFSRMQFVGATHYSDSKKGMRDWSMEMAITAPEEDHTVHIYTMPDITNTRFAVNAKCIDPCQARCTVISLLQNVLLSTGQTPENAAIGTVQALTQKLHPYVMGHYIGHPNMSMLPDGTTWDDFENAASYLTPQVWLHQMGCPALTTDLPGGIPNIVNPNVPCSTVEFYLDLLLGGGSSKREVIDESQYNTFVAALQARDIDPVEYAKLSFAGPMLAALST